MLAVKSCQEKELIVTGLASNGEKLSKERVQSKAPLPPVVLKTHLVYIRKIRYFINKEVTLFLRRWLVDSSIMDFIDSSVSGDAGVV